VKLLVCSEKMHVALERAQGQHPVGEIIEPYGGVCPLSLTWTSAGFEWHPSKTDSPSLPRVILDLDEVLPLLRHFILRENRIHRALRFAGSTVDALVGLNVQFIEPLVRRESGLIGLVDAIDGAHLHAGAIQHINAGFSDDIGHGSASLLRVRILTDPVLISAEI